jgi:anti-sigma-K factor RskA
MPARTHTRTHPVTTGGVDIRLPWWALALPALAFVALLVLILNPSDAHAASGDPAVTHLFERLQQFLAH